MAQLPRDAQYLARNSQDPIKVHSVDLGMSAPRLSRARQKPTVSQNADPVRLRDISISVNISDSSRLHVLGYRAGHGLRRHCVDIPLNLRFIQLSILVIRSTTSIAYYFAFTFLCHGKDSLCFVSSLFLTVGRRYA